MRPSLRFVVGFLITAVIAVHAQAPPQVTDLQSIEGTVVDDATGQPILRARVILGDGDGTALGQVLSDDVGTFALSAVGRGRFVLTAAKAGYVQPAWSRGQPPRVVVAAGETIARVVLRLRRGGVITGVVRDPSGRPLPGATVSAFRCAGFGSCTIGADPPVKASTDANGTYRVFGLRDGRYLVAAQATLSGLSGAVEPTLEEYIRWVDALPRTSASSSAAPPRQTAVPMMYVATFFPNTWSAEQGVPVDVLSGSQRDGVDVTVQLGAPVKVTGMLVDERAPSEPNASLTVLPNHRGPTQFSTVVSVAPDGTFETTPLPPGRYRILAFRRSSAGDFSGFADLDVRGEPLPPVPLRLERTYAVSGRVVGLAPARASDLSGIRLSLRRATVSVWMAQFDTGSAVTDSKGEFVFQGISGGEYELTCQMPKIDSACAATALVGGEDAFDTPLKVFRDVADLRVDFSRGTGVVAGTVRQRDNSAASAYSVVVFPSARGKWDTLRRRIRVAPVARDGSFEVSGLASGGYMVEAAGVNGRDDIDEHLLETLSRTAQAITVVKDSKLNLHLAVD